MVNRDGKKRKLPGLISSASAGDIMPTTGSGSEGTPAWAEIAAPVALHTSSEARHVPCSAENEICAAHGEQSETTRMTSSNLPITRMPFILGKNPIVSTSNYSYKTCGTLRLGRFHG